MGDAVKRTNTANDIVADLRRLSPDCDEETERLVREAADEIEELRRQVDLAWAAGLFDGEGSIYGYQMYRNQVHNSDGSRRKGGVRFKLTMHSTDHDVLRRFAAIVGRGRFYGPYSDKRGDHYKPQLRWETNSFEDGAHVLGLLMPYFGERRRAKAESFLRKEFHDADAVS